MTEKIIGYLLLAAGVLVILISGLNAYSILTRKSQPAQFLSLPALSLDFNQIIAGALPPEARAQMSKSPGNPTELFPAQATNFIINLTLHLLLLGFLVTIGYKLAALGVLLLRPVNVKLKPQS